MEKIYIWEVKPRSTPLLKRKCSHCDCDKFYCSEKFRANAQKKNIDLWLIYRCLKCDNTFNLAIYPRTKTELINKDLFNKFSENNTEIAWRYAFCHETSRKNNVELNFGSVEYDVHYEYIPIEEILNSECENVTFKIKYPFDFSLRVSSVIRICFNLSAKKLDELIESKAISVQGKHLEKKHKVKNEDIVQVSREKLRSIYNIWIVRENQISKVG